MSSAPQGPPNSLPPQEMECVNPVCKGKFVVFQKMPTVANMTEVTLVIFVHEEPQACPHCGVLYQMSFKGFKGMITEWVRVPGHAAGPIIVHPGDFDPNAKPPEGDGN